MSPCPCGTQRCYGIEYCSQNREDEFGDILSMFYRNLESKNPKYKKLNNIKHNLKIKLKAIEKELTEIEDNEWKKQ